MKNMLLLKSEKILNLKKIQVLIIFLLKEKSFFNFDIKNLINLNSIEKFLLLNSSIFFKKITL
jgi:hypothetical protein